MQHCSSAAGALVSCALLPHADSELERFEEVQVRGTGPTGNRDPGLVISNSQQPSSCPAHNTQPHTHTQTRHAARDTARQQFPDSRSRFQAAALPGVCVPSPNPRLPRLDSPANQAATRCFTALLCLQRAVSGSPRPQETSRAAGQQGSSRRPASHPSRLVLSPGRPPRQTPGR